MNESTLEGMGSSGAGDVATPRDFFEALDQEFHFTIDLAAAPGLAMVPEFFALDGFHRDPEHWEPTHVPGPDSLARSWAEPDPGESGGDQPEFPLVGFLNPPYGRPIGDFVRKAFEESEKGATVVALLPDRSDAEWYHRWIEPWRRVEVRHVAGRIAFGGFNPKGKPIPDDQGAFFPSIVVVFRPPRRAAPAGNPERARREVERAEIRARREEEKVERERARRIRTANRNGALAEKVLERARKAEEKTAAQAAARLEDLVQIASDLRGVPMPRAKDDPGGDLRRFLGSAKKISRRYLARRKMGPAPAPAAGVDPTAGPAETKKE